MRPVWFKVSVVIIEDAAVGIEAANQAGMYAVGIGKSDRLPGADLVYPDL